MTFSFAFQLKYLPPPWGDCKDTPFKSPYFLNYSITACRIECETRYILEKCNCRMVHMPGERPLLGCIGGTREASPSDSPNLSFIAGNEAVCDHEQYVDCADVFLKEIGGCPHHPEEERGRSLSNVLEMKEDHYLPNCYN